ncbi:MAG: hypothetical protein A2X36_17225 [Elusimicrobia bacterium GWA2_69_24]|nr:MAG: hypothetical protein A2X36_17225 [Elusimicrobia bacterium GWA2_69_24]HBL19083.1 hypothetical protein [Elusimicrobiota bacterium]
MNRRAAAATLILLVALGVRPAAAAEDRRLVKDRNFSIALPAGFRFAAVKDENGVVAWSRDSDRTFVEIRAFSSTRPNETAGGVAKRHRASIKPEAEGKSQYSEVYRKDLANRLAFFYYSSVAKPQGPVRGVTGYFYCGSGLYQVSGTVASPPEGLRSLYQVLGAIQPTGRDKMTKKAVGAGNKPSALQAEEERSAPPVRLR